jgi:prepilin signal peptidase PulO-like enzyme (type II secretory pathway)
MIWSIILAIINRKKFMEKLKKSIDKKKRFNTLLLISILIIVLDILFIKNYVIKAIIAIIFSLIILYYYLSIIVKAVEDSSLYKIVPVSKLTEGDWVSKNIRLRHRLIYRKDSLGIDKKQINLLKKSKIKRVEIKEGIPFIPSIFLATLATLLFGNLMSFLF